MMGSATVQDITGQSPKGAAVAILGDRSCFGETLTTDLQKQIVGELKQILNRLDVLELWLPGIHLSSAIDAVQKAVPADQALPEA